jgi:response regulator RpfG family c-di-GMP phosphodiesterase
MTLQTDKLSFAKEPEKEDVPTLQTNPWKILIVDDDVEIHPVTIRVMGDEEYSGKKLEFYSAFSGKEAKEILKKHPDIALILLDVVMETDTAGLDVVKYLREDLQNHQTRIMLRTGQPAIAPEKNIIIDYEINDYREKTNLTSNRLYSAIISSLRSYEDIQIINKSQKSLEKIIQSSLGISKLQSLDKFINGVLSQFITLIQHQSIALKLKISGMVLSTKTNQIPIQQIIIHESTGEYENYSGTRDPETIPKNIMVNIEQTLKAETDCYNDDVFTGMFKLPDQSVYLLYIKGCHNFSQFDKKIITLFSEHISIAFENLYKYQKLEVDQSKTLINLEEILENHVKNSENHIKRVSAYSKTIAEKIGLKQQDQYILSHASPLHDIGKIAISDQILHKADKLSQDEFETIKKHAQVGYQLLVDSPSKIMQSAAKIAQQHHERWDGKGYPNGLKGVEIHIFARITTLVDVFDILLHDRTYDNAWTKEKIIDHINNESGKQFDPDLVKVFLENIQDLYQIKSEIDGH